jgi:hypothetical protein
MRNISQFAVSLVLLASQVQIPFMGNLAASASSSQAAVGSYEVKLNTNTASAIQVVGPKQPDYDAEVLIPLHAKQADLAAKAAAAKKIAAKAKVSKAVVRTVIAVQVTGSHADWMRVAGIAESDFGYVDYIIDHESGWGVTKGNYGGSGAYGLGQALPASKMAKFGSDYLTDPVTQLRWANAYAVGSFGSWANAYNHWIARHSW